MMFSTADSVAIYEDEGRFYIRVQTDEGEVILIDIHAQAVGFYENVQAELGGYAREALEARHAVGGLQDLVPRQLEIDPAQHEHVRFVVDHQDLHRVRLRP